MFDIGFLELILIAIIGLLVLGPERLPVAARTLGRWIGKARRMAGQFSKEIDRQMELEELKEELKKQSENLDINEEARKIQDSVNAALKEAEEFEPIPRSEPDLPFSEIGNSNATISNSTTAQPQTLSQSPPERASTGQTIHKTSTSNETSTSENTSTSNNTSANSMTSISTSQNVTDNPGLKENHSDSTSKP